VITRDPFWWDEAGAPKRPPLDPLPREADILIVGAGLTGLSAARTAARAGRDVLVLDSGAPGSGASARGGGMIGGGPPLSAEALDARYGTDTAVSLLRETHIDSLAFAATLIGSEGIDCDFRRVGRFQACCTQQEFVRADRWLDQLRSRVPLRATLVPRDRQREEVATDRYHGGIVFPDHGALNPAKWVAVLMAAARRAGASVQGDTAVLDLVRDGHAFQVTTARGIVRAGQVLLATNGYTTALFSDLRRKLVPLPSFLVATEELGTNRVISLFPQGRNIVETQGRMCYVRPSPDGKRIIFGGRAAMFDIAPERSDARLRRLIGEVFTELKSVRLTHSWRGITGVTFNRLPHLGRIAGIWHAVGYSGSGNALAPWLGHKAALSIMGKPEGETAFMRTGLPERVWHRGKPWFLPAADLAFNVRDLSSRFTMR
jgi:glycine/D-amino acid oxidase-like deaminating enzyme